MSALAFLSVEGGPVARSPFADAAAASGGAIEIVDGWELAVEFGDVERERHAVHETVGFADRSPLGKLELWDAPSAPALGLAERRGDAWWCPLTSERTLVLGGEADGETLDVTAAFAALAIAGPLARELFARFCALDLRDVGMPVGAFRPGSVARTPGMVLREADERWLVLVGAAYGGYLWEVVADAAARLGGRAVGAEVLDA